MDADAATLEMATGRLRVAGCVAADVEAEELVGASLDPGQLESFLRRREEGEPFAWIVGATVFCGHRVHVGRGVYVPRPQTEELARRAGVQLAAAPPGAWAVDLCTGSGAVAVHLMAAVPGSRVVAVDAEPRAARCARGNGVPAIVGDVAQPFGRHVFDVVTAVAPYVPTTELRFLPADVQRHEPLHALDGGGDGLEVVRRVLTSAASALRSGGWLFVEVGGDQDRALASALSDSGFCTVQTWRDEEGDLRGMAAQLAVASGGSGTS